MPFNIPDLYYIMALLVVGAFAGYASGLFGIGGGLVLVPLFLTLFPLVGTVHDQVMHCAVGTSLALILPNCWAAVSKHYYLGNMDTALLKTWLPFIGLGCLGGLFVINIAPTEVLKVIFAVYLYAVFVFVLVKKDPPEGRAAQPGLFFQGLGGVLFGSLSVLLGVGSGAFTTPFLKMFQYPLRRALAISSATGLFIGVIGAVGVVLSGWGVEGRAPFSLGFVNMPAFLLITPMALYAAPRGVNRAHRIHKDVLHLLYAFLLLVMALLMTWHVFYDY